MPQSFGTVDRMFELQGIDHVALAVRDVERAMQWYIGVLGFEHRFRGMWNGVPVFIGKGATALALFPAHAAADAPRRGQDRRPGFLHLAFGATQREFEAAQRDLKSRGIAFTFQDHEICRSIYFEDPDGNHLEITTYEVSE